MGMPIVVLSAETLQERDLVVELKESTDKLKKEEKTIAWARKGAELKKNQKPWMINLPHIVLPVIMLHLHLL